MKVIIHGDDFGLTPGITNNILNAFDYGVLQSTSLIPNGAAFDFALKEAKKRPKLQIAVHLNLVEGEPVSDKNKIPCLLDQSGQLHCSFLSLWIRYLLSFPRKRRELENQVTLELAAQLRKMRHSFGSDFAIRLNSHQHLHMIPFVFRTLMNLHDEFRFDYVRIPSEPFYLCAAHPKGIKNYFSSNLIKHLLLSLLSVRSRKWLTRKKISSSDFFLGLLFTGMMTAETTISGIKALSNRTKAGSVVEILFHPGGAVSGEEFYWKNRPELMSYYFNPWRDRERQVLLSHDLRIHLQGILG